MDLTIIMQLVLSVTAAAVGASIYAVLWWSINNQTDPETWDMPKFGATVLLGAILGILGWYNGIPVTMATIGPLIAGYVFILPVLEKVIKFVIRQFYGVTPATYRSVRAGFKR